MKIHQFLIFFGIVFGIYFIVNYYIYIRGLQAFRFTPTSKTVYTIIYLLLAAAYITGRIIERFAVGRAADFLTWLGSYWLAFMVYFLLLIILIDLLRAVNHFLPFFPAFLTSNPSKTNFTIGCVTVIGISVIVAAGRINATHPVVSELSIILSKNIPNHQNVTIALASDLHLGAVVGQAHLRKLVRMINAIQPDLILLAGDVIDEDPGSLIKRDLGNCL
ncbi:MAG: metallophosphoesterase, partial [Fidelibacterota bacterium]